jgi:hypothetical protein
VWTEIAHHLHLRQHPRRTLARSTRRPARGAGDPAAKAGASEREAAVSPECLLALTVQPAGDTQELLLHAVAVIEADKEAQSVHARLMLPNSMKRQQAEEAPSSSAGSSIRSAADATETTERRKSSQRLAPRRTSPPSSRDAASAEKAAARR